MTDHHPFASLSSIQYHYLGTIVMVLSVLAETQKASKYSFLSLGDDRVVSESCEYGDGWSLLTC
jgi:hypothetical protein